MTYDGTNLELYVNPAASDGKTNFLDNENTGNGRYNIGQVGYQPATSNPLRIGASADASTPDEFFSGVIQNVAVYDAVLSFETIVNHYWIFATGYSVSLPPPGSGFAGEGSLTVAAAFPANPLATTEFSTTGPNTYDIPYWCTYIDLILLGGGGGGANALAGVIPSAVTKFLLRQHQLPSRSGRAGQRPPTVGRHRQPQLGWRHRRLSVVPKEPARTGRLARARGP
jgi:hypothetical protein